MKDIITHLNENIKQYNFVFKGNINQSPYQPVDLGLSVKWCSCNVGAEKPEDPGLLFQWGRTDGYKKGDKNHGFLSKYDYTTTSGTKYKGGAKLKLEDDAAHVNMKGKWRMPTKEEMDELLKLKHEWAEVNGVKGYKFTSENGNSIFIPTCGCFNGSSDSFNNSNSSGNIWTSSVCQLESSRYVYGLEFYSDYYDFDGFYGYHGFSVRGVCE